MVKRHLTSDRVFQDAFDEAHDYHKDLLEWESLSLGRRKSNPLPYFDRLKAELPARHVDRAVIASMSVTAELTGTEAASALREMLASLTPTTQQMLEVGPEAIEAHALPEADPLR